MALLFWRRETGWVNRQRWGQMKLVLSGPESIVREERDIRAGNMGLKTFGMQV